MTEEQLFEYENINSIQQQGNGEEQKQSTNSSPPLPLSSLESVRVRREAVEDLIHRLLAVGMEKWGAWGSSGSQTDQQREAAARARHAAYGNWTESWWRQTTTAAAAANTKKDGNKVKFAGRNYRVEDDEDEIWGI